MKQPPARKSAIARKSTAAAPKARKAISKVESLPKIDAPTGPSAATPRASKNILTAGIKALANAHGEAVARQSRVFESLLGLGHRDATGPSADKPSAIGALDPFGFKKFEDVFDQRVLRTMQRLGVPSAEAFADLTAEVERLREELARLKSPSRKR